MMRGSFLLLICLCFASASGSAASKGVEERQGKIAAIRQALQPAAKTDFPLEWIFSVRTAEGFNQWTGDGTLPESRIALWRRLVAQASNLDPNQVEVRSNWRRRSADGGGQRRRWTDFDAMIYCKTGAQRTAAITRIERNGEENLERIINERYGPILRDIRTEYVGNSRGTEDAELEAFLSEPPSESSSSSGGSNGVNPAVYASLAALIIPIGAGIYCLSKQNAKTQQQLREVVANTRPSATAPPAPGNPSAPTFPRDLSNAQNFPTNPYAVQPSAPTALPGIFR